MSYLDHKFGLWYMFKYLPSRIIVIFGMCYVLFNFFQMLVTRATSDTEQTEFHKVEINLHTHTPQHSNTSQYSYTPTFHFWNTPQHFIILIHSNTSLSKYKSKMFLQWYFFSSKYPAKNTHIEKQWRYLKHLIAVMLDTKLPKKAATTLNWHGMFGWYGWWT